ncbi:unnamed protein product [Prunus armeniaca]
MKIGKWVVLPIYFKGSHYRDELVGKTRTKSIEAELDESSRALFIYCKVPTVAVYLATIANIYLAAISAAYLATTISTAIVPSVTMPNIDDLISSLASGCTSPIATHTPTATPNPPEAEKEMDSALNHLVPNFLAFLFECLYAVADLCRCKEVHLHLRSPENSIKVVEVTPLLMHGSCSMKCASELRCCVAAVLRATLE